VAGTAARQPCSCVRCRDVTARLIELDDHNVRAARERIAAAGLTSVEVIEGDASTTDIYQGHAPAEIVLVCGLFGNLSDADIRRTIRHLPMLCAERASVLWTRGGYLAEQIRSWFIEAGFEEVSYTELPSHSVGVNRFVGTPMPLESGIRMFTFTSSWTLGATEDWLEIHGLRLHYRAWGHPNGPALVLLHGLRGSSELWWGVAGALPGWRVIALDQRGRGASDWATDADYSHQACLLDFEEFVDMLHLGRFALLGHSAGGAVALAYALTHPERVEKLVLEDIGPPTAERPHGESIGVEMSELPLTFASWEAAAAYHRELTPNLSEQRVRSRLHYAFRELPDGTVTWKYDLAGLRRFDPVRNQSFNPWGDIRKVSCPMLVVRGSRSPVVPDEAIDAMRAAKAGLACVDIPMQGTTFIWTTPRSSIASCWHF
jgi:esterase